MGFAEAGRTAARLAVDAVSPFHSEDDGGDRWVMDGEVLDYAPSPRRGSDAAGRRGQGGGRPPSAPPRRRRAIGDRGQTAYGSENRPPRRRVGLDDAGGGGSATNDYSYRGTADDAGDAAAVEGREECTVAADDGSRSAPQYDSTSRKREITPHLR
jgi:hypothetical protein